MGYPMAMQFISLATFLALAIATFHGSNGFEQSSEVTQDVPKGCICVPINGCPNNALPKHGRGRIAFRSDMGTPCPPSYLVCCPPGGPPSSPTIEHQKPKFESRVGKLKLNPPPKCGTRMATGTNVRIIDASNTSAKFAEFPWMVMLFSGTRKNNVLTKTLMGGGSLIHERVVLTAAHRAKRLNTDEGGVRAGEWDTSNENEAEKHQDLPIVEIIIHEQFDEDYNFNDIALLITVKPFRLAPNVGIVCLPKANSVIATSSCSASGWGLNMTGYYQAVLKKVDQLPIVDRNKCQTKIRSWSPEYSKFEVHKSSICAGGIRNKDACQGDGGGPLVCPVGSGPESSRLQQVGITSWGLECGSDFPAIYTNVAHFRPWIDRKMTEHGFISAYDY